MISAHPYLEGKKVLNTQFIQNYAGGEEASYVQMLYLQQMNEHINLDAGFGVSDGEENRRLVAGATYTIFPDFGNQPKVAAKVFFENVRNEEQYVNSVGIAPILSKGFLIGNKIEIYPFISFPSKLALENDTEQYEFQFSFAMGTTMPIKYPGFENAHVNIESNLDLRNSASSIAGGITMSFQ